MLVFFNVQYHKFLRVIVNRFEITLNEKIEKFEKNLRISKNIYPEFEKYFL